VTVSCYIYYRVVPERISEASVAARDTIDRVRSSTGITGQLLTKVDEPLLWMEVYEAITDKAAFLEAMGQCVDSSGISRWLDDGGRRHTEMFQTSASQPAALRTNVS